MIPYAIYAHIIPLIIIVTSFNAQSMFLHANHKPKINKRTFIPAHPKDQHAIILAKKEQHLDDKTFYIYEKGHSCGVLVSKQIALQCNVIQDIDQDTCCKLIPVPYCATTIHNFFSILENNEKKNCIIENCSFNELIDIVLLNEHFSGPSGYLNEKFNAITSCVFTAYNTTIHKVELALTKEISHLNDTNPPSYIFMTKPEFKSDNIKKEFTDSLKQITQFSNENEDFSLLKSLVLMSPTESLYEEFETKNIRVTQKKSIYKELKAKQTTLNILMEDLERLEKEHKVPSYINQIWNYWFNNESN